MLKRNNTFSKKLYLLGLLFFVLCGCIHAQQISIVKTFDEFRNTILKPEQGKTKVVNFWATWCKPCVEELPYFEALTAEKNEDVEVLLVSLDFAKHYDKKLVPFVKKNDLRSSIVNLQDSKTSKWIDLVDPEWSGAIPMTLIITEDEMKMYEKSYHSLAELKADVK